MSTEWQAGDVRVATINGERMLVLRGRGIFEGNWYTQGPVAGSRLSVSESWLIDERPLVVIDPEDCQQVERLVDEWVTARGLTNVEHMRAALREFATPTPPKPDEPQGLGAVVEDAEGVLWTHVECSAIEVLTRNPWYPANDDEEQPREWHDIKAVRVLTEGVVM